MVLADQQLGEGHSHQWAGADKGVWPGVDHTLAEEACNSVVARYTPEAFLGEEVWFQPCFTNERSREKSQTMELERSTSKESCV